MFKIFVRLKRIGCFVNVIEFGKDKAEIIDVSVEAKISGLLHVGISEFMVRNIFFGVAFGGIFEDLMVAEVSHFNKVVLSQDNIFRPKPHMNHVVRLDFLEELAELFCYHLD